MKHVTDKMSRIVKDLVMSEEEAELKKRGYCLGTTLGEGSYAKVKSAFSEKLRKRVAVKIINRKRAPKDFREKFLPRELQVLKVVDHHNVIALFEILEIHHKLYIVMEHAGHGDLLEYIKLRGAQSEDQARKMFKQMMDGIDYLHKNHIAHRDLKCENLLLDSENTLKVSDFGFARFYDNGVTSKTFCGSAAYAAPEVLQGIPYHVPLHDIWAMGIILYIMICASMPYDDSNLKRMVRDQTEKKVSFSKSKKISVDCKDLVHRILEVNVKKRASIAMMSEHPWIRGASGSASTSVNQPYPIQPVTSEDKRKDKVSEDKARATFLTDLHLRPEERDGKKKSKDKVGKSETPDMTLQPEAKA
uniref:Testis-specific serine/threonine-protein kinase 1 n=1 Tax=Haliotis discus hannai TaxID=42344 RepID=A0A2Z4EDH2_HALDH|nr:testis-specific serine/threonine-protein kinase 1 [Haliotis discus hannai]QHR80096.1 TSSK1-like protein [Haliotis discus hannai]